MFQDIIYSSMGAGASALKFGAALTVAQTTMAIVLTTTTIIASELRNQLKKTIEGHQQEFKLMSKFEAILRTFNNNSTAINQVSMSSIQSINNWSTIADNMLKLNSTALKLTEVYGNIKIPNSAWTTTTIVGATLGIVFSIYQSVSLFFEFKNLPKEIARVNEFLESSQTKQRKDALSIKNMRDKGLTDSDTQTSTDTSEVSIVEETANTNKPGSKKVSQTKRNTAKLVKDFAERWGKLIKNAFRSVMAAATVYFFIMELISINQLKQDMREWEQMLGPGGSLEQDEKDLVILLDAIAQDISSLGTASYVAILDFSNSFGVLAMLNPPLSNQFLGLSQLWNGQTLVPHFSMKRVNELYDFSKEITKLHIDFDKYMATHTPQETRKQVIVTLEAMYDKFIVVEPVDTTNPIRISTVFNNIAKQINNNSPYASLLSNFGLNELTFFSEFSKANQTGFSSRNTKITNANLWDKIKNKSLNADEVKTLYGFDRVCLNGVVNSYIVLMINPFVPEGQQIDTGEDLADKLVLLSAVQKNDISVTLMQRFENFFFDNSTPPEDLKTAGTTIFGIKIFKMDQTNQDFVNRPSIPNMIYIPDNFTAVESEDVLIKKYKSINPNLVSEDKIKKRERVIFMELGSAKHLNFDENFDFFQYRRGLLITAEVNNLPKFYILVSNSLSGEIWTFKEFEVPSKNNVQKMIGAH